MSKIFLKLGMAFCAIVISLPSMADISDDLANICTIVKNNDKSELRKKINKVKKEYKVTLSDYYTGITCSGLSLIRHAMASGAGDAGEYLIKQMRKSELSQPEADGKTIKQWAEENGHIGSPTGAALLERLG
ncbi:DUF3718 domain-containing protein [Paraneptunicella aestuarii]|uniref:DUF3718 domain-containing protein n=1 Tax=Paraneptunicella aestuarii TaxID=2831148 RepID=UPI001E51D72F|nr:DUF3718 domain-containing protein [Paraneptunicella aestuarii]UAA38388.1 DUF3718 domain-containing protein [Paraneptunicella aestuarii]